MASMQQQVLFDGTDDTEHAHPNRQEQLSALDELYWHTDLYRRGIDYMNLIDFIGRLPRYSPFNALLLYNQNPYATYVATPTRWARKFNRTILPGARPLIIMKPFGPVEFVFDVSDTIPVAGGVDILKTVPDPFGVRGRIGREVLRTMILNAWEDRIYIHAMKLEEDLAGYVRPTDARERVMLELSAGVLFYHYVALNEDHTREQRFCTLAHELAHIFCGHIPTIDRARWWQNRTNVSQEVREVEAESVAYLVGRRAGVDMKSYHYLAGYMKEDAEKVMPRISLAAILDAVAYIESMKNAEFKSKRKKATPKQPDLFEDRPVRV